MSTQRARASRRASLLLAVLAAASLPGTTAAQPYPSKPIRFIVAYPPGGATDIVARVIAAKLSELTGQSVIVDNRAGASGMIGAQAVAKAPTDGYTVLISASNEVAVNVALFKKMPYDPLKDLAPVSLLGISPVLLAAHPSVPVKNVKDVVALARARDGRIEYGSVGLGTPNHFAGELLSSMAGVKLVHVPYKGASPAMVDLMGGQIPLAFLALASALPQVKSGKLHAIAITTPQRFSGMPDLPTIAEGGYPGFDMSQWYGGFVPTGTPAEVIARLNADLVKIVKMPDVRQRVLEQGADLLGTPPEALASFVAVEIRKYAKLAAAANVRME